MKKIIVTLAVILMSASALMAQSHGWFWFGPKAGFTSNASNVKLNADGAKQVFNDAQNFNAGLMFRFNAPVGIFSLHLQPELMYNWKRGQFSSNEGSANNVNVKDFKINEFSIPVLAGVGLDLGLFNARVQAGPSVKFNSDVTVENATAKNNGINWKDVTYSWAADVGVDIFNFIMIDVRYLGGWKEGMEPKTIGELFKFDNIDKKTDTWNLSVGIMF